MTYRRFFVVFLVFSGFFLWFSCVGSPEGGVGYDTRADLAGTSDEWTYQPSLSDLIFVPASFPSLQIALGVGLITQENRDPAAALGEEQQAVLSGAFRSAYVDGLLRDLPLAGVLGGDFVHGWPPNDPSSWVQNWRSSDPADNSWGIPSLILAVQGMENPQRVFIVQGDILDHYGKSAGINGANGSAGYGSPISYEFIYRGNLAQRFDLGLITVDQEGKGDFIPQDPLSVNLPSDIGTFVGSFYSHPDVQEAFITAWRMALGRGVQPMIPDGPGQYLSLLGASWNFSGGGALEGIYIQTFNRRSILLVLPVSSLFPMYPRFIASPFLDALLDSSNLLPGGEYLTSMNVRFRGGDGFSTALMAGLSMYGIPLTDPMPVNNSGRWQEAQRFSRGWIVAAVGGN